MNRSLQSQFHTRQHMLSKDFELYYYSDRNLSKVDWHSHDYYEFYFFLEGDVVMQAGEQSYAVREGDILMIPPAVRHRLVIQSRSVPYRRFVFWISRDYCAHLRALSGDYVYLADYAASSRDYCFHTTRITANEIQSKLLRILEEMQGERFGRDAQLVLFVNDLILHLSRILYTTHNPARAVEQALYRQLALFIEEHLDEELSLERLADEFFVSRYHIAHVFKDNFGMSIHQYITKKRLARCRQAILSSRSITEAYESCGFGDYSSFYRAFRKEYGISPRDFRDMQQVGLPDR